MDVRVVLEELVLDGVDPRDPRVVNALELALAQSLPGTAQEVAAEVAAAVAKETAA